MGKVHLPGPIGEGMKVMDRSWPGLSLLGKNFNWFKVLWLRRCSHEWS